MSRAGVDDLVSVIVPTYNRDQFLSDAINSIYHQTYRPIELLIVDDGSTDNTADIVERARGKFQEEPHLTLQYIWQQSQGAPAARNRGLQESRGEYIQFLDSDDVLHPRKLEVHVGVLKDKEHLDFVWSGFDLMSGEKFESFPVQENLDTRSSENSFSRESSPPVVVWSGVYRRTSCRKIGPWDESLQRWQDVEYNFRFSCLSPTVARISGEYYRMRAHDEGRIVDSRKDEGGIRKGLHTLRVVDETVASLDPKQRPDTSFLRGFYFKIMTRALANEKRSQAEEAIQGALRYSAPGKARATLRILQAFYHVLGPRITSSLLSMYSWFRLSNG
jgi:glycosyltransferase involved in cell wall biosynthesis